MHHGELTVTLQDVEVILGLPLDGIPVVARITGFSWIALCQRLLGVIPPRSAFKGHSLSMPWLSAFIGHLPHDADYDHILRWTRGYILLLIGVFYFLIRVVIMYIYSIY